MLRIIRRGAALARRLGTTFAADAPPDSYTFATPQRMLFAHSGRASSGLVRQLSTHPSPPPPGSGPDPGEAGGGQAAPEGQAQGGGHRDQLLVAAMKHVKTLGWTDDALRAAASDLGLSAASVGLLPRGAAELVEHFNTQCDAEFVARLQASQGDFDGMRMRDRIAKAVRMRLELNAPYMSGWAQALSLQAHPSNAVVALQQRAALFDEIWHFMGDTSTDMTWYTKRATLGAVYSATELFMITDVSPEFEDTWAFLDRRIADTMAAGKAIKELTQAASTWLEGSMRK